MVKAAVGFCKNMEYILFRVTISWKSLPSCAGIGLLQRGNCVSNENNELREDGTSCVLKVVFHAELKMNQNVLF